MAEHQLTAIDVEVNEETPYFFQRIGELAFDRTKSPEYAKESARKRQRECIAAAPHYGVAAIAGEEAVYVARTIKLIASTAKLADEEEVVLADSSAVCAARINASLASVHISSNGLLLAVCEAARIRTWAIADLLRGKQDALLSDWKLGNEETFFWRPTQAESEATEAAVVTSSGRLLHATLGGQLGSHKEGSAEVVSCAAWSLDGSMLAFASGNRIIIAAVANDAHFRAAAKLPEAEEDGLTVIIESMAWAGPDALVLSCSLYGDASQEEERASVCMLHWASWQPESGQDPEGLALALMSDVNTDPERQPGGHYHQSLVAPWQVAVAAHGKASDNHILVLETAPAHGPKLLEILDDSCAIRIPLAADYTDNFVTGLGIVYTGTEEVAHPDPEHGNLPPQPILLVATSDGALRLFAFSSARQSVESVTHPALSYDDAPYPAVSAAPKQACHNTPSGDGGAATFAQLGLQSGSSQTSSTLGSPESNGQQPASPFPPSAASPGIRPSEEAGTTDAQSAQIKERSQPQPAQKITEEPSDNEAIPASRAAATALPDSDDDFEEDSPEPSTESGQKSIPGNPHPAEPAELHNMRSQLGEVADEAGKAAHVPLPSSDEEADEDLESQASVSMPAVPAQGRPPKQGFGRADRYASLSQADESSMPQRPMRRLDSLSASDTESAEVQSRPDAAPKPAQEPDHDDKKPPAFSWPGTSGTAAPAFELALSGSSAAAAPSVAAPLFGAPSPRHDTWSLQGSTPAFGQPATLPARQASGALQPFNFPMAKPAQAPQVPRQSAAQQAIAKAREGALAAKSSKPAAESTGPLPAPQKPAALHQQPLSTAGPQTEEGLSWKRADSAGADRSHRVNEVKQTPEPPAPKARLQEEGKELASMEREFLKSLAETRAIEAKLTAEIVAAEGTGPGQPGTKAGALGLQEQTRELADSVGELRSQLAADRTRFSALHSGWKDDRARAEALLFFNGKRDFLDEDEAVYASEDVDPSIQELVAYVQEQLPALQQQSLQLSDGIQALKGSAKQGHQQGSVQMQQLYNALNLQKEVALSQVLRVQKLWERMQELGILDPDASSLEYPQPVQQNRTPTESGRSSRSPYVRMSRSPWSQGKGGRSPLLLPTSSKAAASKSPWAEDSAATIRALLLEKVASHDGGIRLTRLEQPPKAGREPGGDAAEKGPSRPKSGVSRPSSLQPQEDAGRPRIRSEENSKRYIDGSAPQHAGAPARKSPVLNVWAPDHAKRKDSAAQPEVFGHRSSADGSFESEGHSVSSPAQTPAAKVSRPRDQPQQSAPSLESAQRSQAPASRPGPARQAHQASKDEPDMHKRPAFTGFSSAPTPQPGPQMSPAPSPAAAHAKRAADEPASMQRRPLANATQEAAAKPADAPEKPAYAAPKSQAAKMPPIPSRAALKNAQAHGEALLAAKAAKMAAERAASTAVVSSAAVASPAPLGFSIPNPAQQAPNSTPQFNFLSSGFGGVISSEQSLSFSLASASTTPAALATSSAASSAASGVSPPSLFGGKAAPASFQLASQFAAPVSGEAGSAPGIFGGTASFASTPTAAAASEPLASAMSVQQPGTATSLGQPATLAFPGLSSESSALPASASLQAQAPTPISGTSASPQPAETLTAGFGLFGGLGLQTSGAPGSAASPFGKGLSFASSPAPALSASTAPAFGASAAPAFGASPFKASPAAPAPAPGGFGAPSSAAAPFAAFGQTSLASAAAPSAFGGFGQAASAAAPAATPFGGFGAPTGFGQGAAQGAAQPAPSPGFGGFGQAASIAPGFRAPATPGFGQAATPAFGAPASPGFGSPGVPAFGASASIAAPFGAPSSGSSFGGGFAAAASQTGGFGSVAAQGSPGNAFGAAAQQNTGGGFGAFGGAQPQSGGFGGFGAGAPAPAPPLPQTGSMWAPRK